MPAPGAQRILPVARIGRFGLCPPGTGISDGEVSVLDAGGPAVT